MCHEEESKNKNGEFERFIVCAQCNGKSKLKVIFHFQNILIDINLMQTIFF